MSDNREALEAKVEELVSRLQLRQTQLSERRQALKELADNLAAETENQKWERYATQHATATGRIGALVDEVEVITENLRLTRLGIVDIDLAEATAEINTLMTEQTGLRQKLDVLRDDFRRAISKRAGDFDTKQHLAELKTEITSHELAWDLTRRHIDAAKKRRDAILHRQEGLL
jgi:hypothetical protein